MRSRAFAWHPNALLLPLGGHKIRVFQPDAGRNVLGSWPLLEIAAACAGRSAPLAELAALHARLGPELKVAEATEFSLFDCAFRNSAMCANLEELADRLEGQPFEDFLEILLDASVLTENWPPRDDFKKRGFADRHRGSFNEQVATECLYHRISPSDWWVRQKFTADAAAARPGRIDGLGT